MPDPDVLAERWFLPNHVNDGVHPAEPGTALGERRCRRTLAMALRDAISDEQVARSLVAIACGRDPHEVVYGEARLGGDWLPNDSARLAAWRMLLERRNGMPEQSVQIEAGIITVTAEASPGRRSPAVDLEGLSDEDFVAYGRALDVQARLLARARGEAPPSSSALAPPPGVLDAGADEPADPGPPDGAEAATRSTRSDPFQPVPTESERGLPPAPVPGRTTDPAAVELHKFDGSSALRAGEYDPAARVLVVTFTNGQRWRYHDVPAEEWRALREARSAGSHWHVAKQRYRGEPASAPATAVAAALSAGPRVL